MNDFQAISLKMRKIKRFIIAGSIGAITHFSILILLAEYGGFSIIFSTTMAFLVASVVSFTLQKLWTFESYDIRAVPSQMFLYVSVTVLNMALNALSMYAFTQKLEWHYLVAQFIISSLIAIESYMLYKYFVFQPRKSEGPTL